MDCGQVLAIAPAEVSKDVSNFLVKIAKAGMTASSQRACDIGKSHG
jgi:hypothetical protein